VFGFCSYNESMIEKVHEEIDVLVLYRRGGSRRRGAPQKFSWRGRVIGIQNIDMHHTVREGRHLYHVFSVSDGTRYFRLKFNSENLAWTLEEFSDGLAD